jgi:hypothetical protein
VNTDLNKVANDIGDILDMEEPSQCICIKCNTAYITLLGANAYVAFNGVLYYVYVQITLAFQ